MDRHFCSFILILTLFAYVCTCVCNGWVLHVSGSSDYWQGSNGWGGEMDKDRETWHIRSDILL